MAPSVWREIYASALCSYTDWATRNLNTYERTQVVCEITWGKDVATCFSSRLTTEIMKFAALSLATDALMVRKRCWLLEGKATQQIEQQTENRSDNCILGTIIYAYARHTSVTRNSNQATRHSLPGGVDNWAQDYPGLFYHLFSQAFLPSSFRSVVHFIMWMTLMSTYM